MDSPPLPRLPHRRLAGAWTRLVTWCVALVAGWLWTSPHVHGQAGRVDPGFNLASLGLVGDVNAVAVQADGKVLVAGGRRNILRLNADGSLDAGFAPSVEGTVESVTVQADGKILLAGFLFEVNGQARRGIARLNADGSLDAGFTASGVVDDNFAVVDAVVVQADGRILLGGKFTQVNGQARNGIARLDRDGSLEAGVNVSLSRFNSVKALAVQADGKIILAGTFTEVNGQPRNRIARLNADGSLDAGFAPGVNDDVHSVAVQADGKIVIGGRFEQVDGQARPRLARLNADGSLDAGFNPSANSFVSSVTVLADGKLLLGGNFTEINGQARRNVVRLNPDGSFDAGFVASADGNVDAVAVQADGRILLGGRFTQVNGQGRNSVARVTSNGELDQTFAADLASGPNSGVERVAVQADGKVLLAGNFTQVNGLTRTGLTRFNANGSLDASFAPGVNATVFTVAVQPDGKIVIGGGFTEVNGVARNRLARLNADGSLDAGFAPDVNSSVSSVAVQADGKIVLGGFFITRVNGQARGNVARLNADGSLDAGFAPRFDPFSLVNSVAVQADGKIIVEGDFDEVNEAARNNLARLNADGSLDDGFNPSFAIAVGDNDPFFSVAVQPNGKFLLGGNFTQINGVARVGLARFNVDGSLDAGFAPNVLGDIAFVNAVQPDGKIIARGTFTEANGQTRTGLVRLNADGGLDPGFAVARADDAIYSAAVQLDGKIVLGGFFIQINGSVRNYVARLNADGSLDTGFNPAGVPSIAAVLRQPDDGRVLIGGEFSSLASRPTPGLARLNPDGSLDDAFAAPFAEGSSVQALAFDPAAGDDALLVAALLPVGEAASVPALAPESLHPRGGGPRSQSKLRNRITRLKASGALDLSFNPNASTDGTALTLATQPLGTDRRILVGGNFGQFNGTPRANLGRLLPDGSLDDAFRADANGAVRALKVQPADGKIVVAGAFTAIAGQNRARLARLNADGSLDAAFNPGAGTDGPVDSLALQPADGKIVLGGRFTSVNGQPRAGLARLNPDGSLDADFNPGPVVPPATRGHVPGAPVFRAVGDPEPGVATVNAIDVFRDGKIVVGGEFGAIGTTARRRVARLNGANGSADATFDPGAGPDAVVRTLQLQPDGKTLLGGDFAVVDTSERSAVARLLGDGDNGGGGPPDSGPVVVSVVGTSARGGFVVSCTGSLGAAVTVVYRNGGSAVRGVDYEQFPGRLTLPAGQNQAVIPVRLLPGANRNRKVKVFLDAGEGYSIGKAQSKVFLSDL